MNVDILRFQRRFETLQFNDCFVDLQIHAPKTLVWSNQFNDNAVSYARARVWCGKYSCLSCLCGKKIRQCDPATQFRIAGHFHETAVGVDLPGDGILFDRDTILAPPANLDRHDHRKAPSFSSLCICAISCHWTLFDRHRVSFSARYFWSGSADKGLWLPQNRL